MIFLKILNFSLDFHFILDYNNSCKFLFIVAMSLWPISFITLPLSVISARLPDYRLLGIFYFTLFSVFFKEAVLI